LVKVVQQRTTLISICRARNKLKQKQYVANVVRLSIRFAHQFGARLFSLAPPWHRFGRGAFGKLAALSTRELDMLKQKLLEEVSARISEVLAASPARDVEKNLKASLAGVLARLDLVTREEFDVQAQVLARTREQLQALEARLARLEGSSDA